jgi:hypothetical protein
MLSETNQLIKIFGIDKDQEKLYKVIPMIHARNNIVFVHHVKDKVLYLFNAVKLMTMALNSIEEKKHCISMYELIQGKFYEAFIDKINFDGVSKWFQEDNSIWYMQDGKMVQLDMKLNKTQTFNLHYASVQDAEVVVPGK